MYKLNPVCYMTRKKKRAQPQPVTTNSQQDTLLELKLLLLGTKLQQRSCKMSKHFPIHWADDHKLENGNLYIKPKNCSEHKIFTPFYGLPWKTTPQQTVSLSLGDITPEFLREDILKKIDKRQNGQLMYKTQFAEQVPESDYKQYGLDKVTAKSVWILNDEPSILSLEGKLTSDDYQWKVATHHLLFVTTESDGTDVINFAFTYKPENSCRTLRHELICEFNLRTSVTIDNINNVLKAYPYISRLVRQNDHTIMWPNKLDEPKPLWADISLENLVIKLGDKPIASFNAHTPEQRKIKTMLQQ